MTLTCITCTYERPAALALCHRYMARQTRQPDQWIILDGPEPMREKMMTCLASGQVEGDAVIVWEDDDHYAPTWLEWCEKHLARYDIVGQGNALYYHAGMRWWSECKNTRHASLCNTAFRRSTYQPLVNLIKGFDNQFFDTRLWRLDRNRYLHMPKDGERLVIGMKGLPGRQGYSPEHKQQIPPDVHADFALLKLWQTIGRDALNYAPFYTPIP